jgi:penicillin V acylase-like amidase (Ntn superfamily)/uncharacterized protein (DUF2141 family)
MACSAFYWAGKKIILGRNLDWYHGAGYIIKNNRGQEKYTYLISNTKAAHWVSKYGSLTFNQIGKEFPYGGINEKGLVVEQLWLHATTYQDNQNESVSELEWIQYQLDNYENIDQIIKNINTLTIKPVKATVHYFIADRFGNSAVIDFIGGKVFISPKEGISQALTNTNYQASCNYYKQNNKVNNASRLSEDRFCQVSENLKTIKPEDYKNAFKILSLSAENEKNYKTFWTIVYDITNLEIQFKTFGHETVKTIKLKDFDYAPNAEILGADLNTDVLEIKSYTFDLNKKLLAFSTKAMNIQLDIDLAAQHQYSPVQKRVDSVYINTYATLKVRFHLKRKKGNLYYTVAHGQENFNRRRGTVANMIVVDSTTIYSEAYAIVKGEYGLASFQDINGNKKLDGGAFGIPKEPYAFSKNKRGLFGLPPKYRSIKFDIQKDIFLNVKF